MISELTLKNNVRIVCRFSSEKLIIKYKEDLNIDIKYFLKDEKEILLYECLDSGYKFFSPKGIEGDSLFYKNLEKFDWYYDPWKWEHEVASRFCSPGQRILEVGCGKGSFIKYLEEKKDCECIGLEINGQRESNPVIINESIQDHSKSNSEKYDVVACFQVLEHIYEVRDFLDSCISCLKPGGKLIISVPNNDGFIGKDLGNDLLNMPPHHMGLWDAKSLSYLVKVFPLKVEVLKFEPLRPQHVSWFLSVYENIFFANHSKLRILFRKLKFKGFFKKLLHRFPYLVKGHTIIAIYTKV